ncbi:unnamed protein product [Caenorhabditis auriculariae]|uniref:Very-long-chain (3R)-3-hydroxyacyl-CoA dehydratase n=1 Tax=Caenorhabditis auriculariae TaxID=2777116 RepID=A0A8S1GWI2_9PELO|nr:unnamed protein product [Caenorhabditis auriculariae]
MMKVFGPPRDRPWVSAYLSSYNVLLFLLNLIAFWDLFNANQKGNFNFSHHYDYLLITTFAQILEVVHAKMGLTKADPKPVLKQVLGRLAVLVITSLARSVWKTKPTYLLCLAYVSSELVRYPYYVLRTLNYNSWVTNWLRYNSFLVLYPIGFLCEAITFYGVFNDIYNSGKWKYTFDKPSPFSINAAIFLAPLALFAFPYLAYTLFSHMWAQRKARLFYAKKTR